MKHTSVFFYGDVLSFLQSSEPGAPGEMGEEGDKGETVI